MRIIQYLFLMACLFFGSAQTGKVTNAKPLFTFKGDTIASASTLTLGYDGNQFVVSGTTTIDSIAMTYDLNSIQPVTLIFEGSLTLTHSDDLLLNNGGNDITTVAGDVAKFERYAPGQWLCTNYTRADGTALVGGVTISNDANNRVVTAVGDGTLNAEPNMTFDGNVGTITGQWNVDNLRLDGNTLSSTNTDGDINLTPDGTGSIIIDGLTYPSTDGNSGQFLSTDGAGVLTFQSSGNGGVTKVGTPVDNQIGVWTGDGTIEGTNELTFSNTGRLGIGTSSPSDRLDVVGTINSSSSIKSVQSLTTGQPLFFYSQNSANNQLALRFTEESIGSIPIDFWHLRMGGSGGAQGIIIGNTNNTLFTIRTNGDVGINTSSPSATLDVVGNAEINGAIIVSGGIQNVGNAVIVDDDLRVNEFFYVKESFSTIESGSITITSNVVLVNTEGGASTDDLEDISGTFANGTIIYLRPAHTSQTVVVKDGVNIQLSGGTDFTMDNFNDTITLLRTSGRFIELSRSDNGN